MSKKIWTEKINKHTDWGGDDSTDLYPVSGERVQEFIKESLNARFGGLLYDSKTNSYLIFSDAEDKAKYEEDPLQNLNLILDVIKLGEKHNYVSEREWGNLEKDLDSINEGELYFVYEDDDNSSSSGIISINEESETLVLTTTVSGEIMSISGTVTEQTLTIL